MDSIKSQLVDMGFDETKIKRAIESCPEAKTLEQVMEWLIAHEDELNNPANLPKLNLVDSMEVEPSASGGKSSAAPKDPSQEAGGPNESAAHMAARKKITVEEAQRMITERQAKRIEEEHKKEIEDEKQRRLAGQKMAETRQELQDQERIILAQQIRREKLEKELHKKQLLEQIARDREAMRNKHNPQVAATTPSASSSSTPTKDSMPKNPATECRLALRFPDGLNKVQKFSPQEQLAAVRLFVQLQKPTSSSIEFVAPPNKKFTESMMDQTLENLGLCPASRLEVKYTEEVWTDLD